MKGIQLCMSYLLLVIIVHGLYAYDNQDGGQEKAILVNLKDNTSIVPPQVSFRKGFQELPGNLASEMRHTIMLKPNVGSRQTACFINVVSRDLGSPLNTCPDGTEQDGLLCYPPCKDGYYGLGPVCWKSCPSDLTDFGFFCMRSYWKGCCCTWFGCCGCPSGYTDDGCFCRKSLMKKSYGRGVGEFLICGPGKEQSGALCYEPCPSGYSGIGPTCWLTDSPSEFPVKCNDVLWAVDQDTCDLVNTELSIMGIDSSICLGVAFASIATIVLLPLAVFVCRGSVDTATRAVYDIIKLTGAEACPSGGSTPI